MNSLFTHQNVQQHWRASEVGAIEFDELGPYCFSDVDSERWIEVYRASAIDFHNTLSFWVAVAKVALGDGTTDGKRWVNEYLSGGASEGLTAIQFRNYVSQFTNTLLPENAFDVPEPSGQFVRVLINNLDEALVGVVSNGYWALRRYFTS